MSDPLEARRRELLGDAEFARLAAKMGADTDQKRAELAGKVAEAFCSRGQIETDDEVAGAGQETMNLQKYVQWWGKQKVGGKRKGKLSKKARKQSRSRGNRGPFAAAAKQKFRSWGQKLRPARIDPMPTSHAKAAAPRRTIAVTEERGEPCRVTWAQAAGRAETAVHLERLPAEVRLQENFPEPIHYDAESKRLIYRGFLVTSSFRYLLSLSSDLDYIRAIHELNAHCVAVDSGKNGGGGKGLWWVLGMVALAAAAGLAWLLWR